MATATHRLVGRDGELRRLDDAVGAAAAGEPAFILVLGEAGIGKTSLLRAAEANGRGAGIRVLSGTAIESGRGIPYLPLVSPLAAALDPKATDDATRVVRNALAARGTADDGTPASSADFQQARLIEAMFEVLVRIPTLLSVDDVHWADESTIAVLDYLAHRATDAPLAVICGARDDEPSLLALLPLADGRRFAQLPVRRLTRDETAEQARQLGRSVSGRRLDALHRRTAGNPFFVEQALADDATGSDADGAAATPAALRALVTRRAARLSGDARAFVEAVAVLGRPVDQPLAAEVADLGVDQARAALAAAVSAGIVVSGPNGIEVRHPLFSEVIRGELDGARRRELHRRAALGLEARGADAAELAGHWWRAGDRDRTWTASLAAASVAEATHAFAEQHWHLEHAIDAWPDGEPGRGQALLDAARAAWISDDAEAAVRLARAAEHADAPLVQASIALGAYAWDTGDRRTSIEAFERVAPLLDEISDPGLRARALFGLGRARVPTDPQASVRFGLEAAEQAALAGDPVEESEGLTLAAMAQAWTGSLDGIPLLERSLDVALEARAPSSTGHASQFLVGLLMVGGELDRGLDQALRGIDDCERLGVARVHASDLRGYAALFLIERGRWDDVEPMLAPADPRAIPGLARAILAIRRGDDAAADDGLHDATTASSIGGPGIRGGNVEIARVERAWLSGDDRTATEELDRVELVRGVWTNEVGAWRARWRARVAPQSADPAAIRAEIETSLDVEARPAMLAEANAELAERHDRVEPDEATAGWAAAADAWQAAKRPYDVAYARLRQAEAGFRTADREAARGALRAASATFSQLGALPLLHRAEDLARRARVAVHEPQPRRAALDDLTERERGVLELIAEGLTNPQIAERLFLSRKTVGIHVSRILDKLGVHTRGQAVAEARRRGILQ